MARGHAPDQVIAKVRQGQKMLNEGHPMIEVIKELQITEATWYRWLNQYGSEKNAEASKRTKELEKENARLKKLLADRMLANDTLTEVAKGKFEAPNHAAVPYGWRWMNSPASERFACQVLGQNRSALRKKKSPMSFNEAQLRADLRRRVRVSGLAMAQGPLAPIEH